MTSAAPAAFGGVGVHAVINLLVTTSVAFVETPPIVTTAPDTKPAPEIDSLIGLVVGPVPGEPDMTLSRSGSGLGDGGFPLQPIARARNDARIVTLARDRRTSDIASRPPSKKAGNVLEKSHE